MGLFKSNIQKTIKKLKEDQLNKIEPLKLSFNVLIQRLNNERRKLKDLEELIKLQEKGFSGYVVIILYLSDKMAKECIDNGSSLNCH